MIHRRKLCTGAILAAIASILATVSGASAQTGPMVESGKTVKLSTHVYAISDNNVPGVPNVGFVVGDTAILVVDTGMGEVNGETVLAEARSVGGGRKIYLVTTHVHPEHDLGAQAFPASATMIRAQSQVEEIADDGMRVADAFRARSDTNKRLLEGAAFRKADTTFLDTYALDLGGVKVDMQALGPAHTRGDTAIFVQGDRVLFSGDLAMKAPPAFASPKSSLKKWLASLDLLDAFRPEIVVPSHGPIGDASYMADYRTYLERIQERTQAFKSQGKSEDEAVAAVTDELKADYPQTARAAGAIRSAYNEAP